MLSRYSSDILLAAYKNIQFQSLSAHRADTSVERSGEMHFQIDGTEYDIDIVLHITKEQADMLMNGLFSALPLLDAYVQNDGPDSGIDNYIIDSLHVYDRRVELEYLGAAVNTQFDAELLMDHGTWYCSAVGLHRFNPPLSVQ